MWNLSYGYYGQTLKVGNRDQQAKPPRPKKRRKAQPLKAKKAFRVLLDAHKVPLCDRQAYLAAALHRGAWIGRALLNQRRQDFEDSKRILLPLQGKRCYVCRKKATVRHHIIPLFRGGPNRISNLVPLCAICHGALHPWLMENLSTAPGDTTPAAPVIVRRRGKPPCRLPQALSLQRQASVDCPSGSRMRKTPWRDSTFG